MNSKLSPDLLREHYKTFYEHSLTKSLCDITLVCDDGVEISAHRNILAAESSFFSKLFNNSFKDRFAMKEIESEVLHRVVKFAYTLELEINEQNFAIFMETADFFGLKHAENLFFDCIKTNINDSNCIDFMKTTKLLSNKELYKFCFNYVLKNFCKMVISDSGRKILNELMFDDVKMMISNNHFVDKSHEQVFDFILGWILYNPRQRNRCLPMLIKYVNLSLIPKNKLQRISEELLLTNNKQCLMEVVKQIIDYLDSLNCNRTINDTTIYSHSSRCELLPGIFFYGLSRFLSLLPIKTNDN